MKTEGKSTAADWFWKSAVSSGSIQKKMIKYQFMETGILFIF